MKKLIYLVIIFITASCSDFLEEEAKGILVPETFYSNAKELDLAITGLYQAVVTSTFNDQVLASTLGGNDITSKFEDFREFDIFNPTGDNAQTSRYWAENYQVIATANELILNYQNANATEQEKNQAAGQAYFARAYCYFTLVRIWNKIPLYTTNEIRYDIVPSNPEDVYALVIEDLKKAEEMLPPKWTDHKKGIGFTSGAAKSLLSYVYLTMTGFPVKDVSKYALAAQKAKEVIENENTYGYRLLENFEDLWKWESRFNDEIVFGLFFAFDARNNQRAPLGQMPTEYGGWDVYYAEINFFNDFPAGPRKDATFVTSFPMEDGRVLDWTETLQKHPYYYKLWDVPGFSWDNPWKYIAWKSERTNYVLRYANVLLTYAEAQAMAGTPDDSAYEAVNRVRNRAGLPDLTEGLSKEAFRDSVIAERSWEFAGGEFGVSPWYDLVRMERVEQAAANRHAWELELTKTPAKADYFAPYPDVDVQRNPNLTR